MTDRAPEPGIYYGIPFADYAAWPYLSKSRLGSFATSPAQYQLALRTPWKQSDAMLLGSAVDTLWFDGPGAYAEGYAVMPDGMSRRGASYVKFRDAASGASKAAIPATLAQYAADMARALDANSEAAVLKAHGESQVSLVWDHPTTGIRMKGRPDLVLDQALDGVDEIPDMKTARDNGRDGWSKALGEFNYHWQAHLYLQAMTELTGRAWSRASHITVRNTPEHSVAVYPLADSALACAEDEVERMLWRFRQCSLDNHWPADAEPSQQPVGLKPWRLRKGNKDD